MARRIIKAGGSSGAGQLARRVSKEETDTVLSFFPFFPWRKDTDEEVLLERKRRWRAREWGTGPTGSWLDSVSSCIISRLIQFGIFLVSSEIMLEINVTVKKDSVRFFFIRHRSVAGK